MAPVPMRLNDLEGHFCCLNPGSFVVLLSFKFTLVINYLYFSIVQRWSFYVSVSFLCNYVLITPITRET